MDKTMAPISDVKRDRHNSDSSLPIFHCLEAVAFHNGSNQEAG